MTAGTFKLSCTRVMVWDPGVRLFHWSLVGAVGRAWLLTDPRWLHRRIGYAVIALVAFRLVWGVVSTQHARWADLVPGPGRLIRYLVAMVRGRDDLGRDRGSDRRRTVASGTGP